MIMGDLALDFWDLFLRTRLEFWVKGMSWIIDHKDKTGFIVLYQQILELDDCPISDDITAGFPGAGGGV